MLFPQIVIISKICVPISTSGKKKVAQLTSDEMILVGFHNNEFSHVPVSDTHSNRPQVMHQQIWQSSTGDNMIWDMVKATPFTLVIIL